MHKLFATVSILAALATSAGCNLKGSADAGATAGKDCVKQDVTQLVGSADKETLIARVTEILVAGLLDWRAELAVLAHDLGACGTAAVNAAVEAAVDSMVAHMSATANDAAASHAEPADSAAIARGRAYLAGSAL